jgi:4'-phosphopantetheinyl transferase EntD
MQLDSAHATVIALRELITPAHVAGGSFGAWLPPPGGLSSTERERAFQTAQQQAVQQCISALLRAAGLQADTKIATEPTGERNWPAKFVGSLTHKGAVVLGAMAKRSKYVAIGIDLERIADHQALPLDQHSIAPEGIPVGPDPRAGTLISFSAKEAVFKAQFPGSRRRLDFSDVVVAWEPAKDFHFSAVAAISGGQNLEVRSRMVFPWIVCVAFRLANEPTSP